jgi:alpha-glucosidase (family GH31 glycosyl hydrolase)
MRPRPSPRPLAPFTRLLALATLTLSLLPSCGDDTPAPTDDTTTTPDSAATDTPTADDDAPDAPDPRCAAPPDWQEAALNGWRVRLDRRDGAWEVWPPHAQASDGPTLAGLGTCAAGGAPLRVASGEPEVQSEFGAFLFRLDRGLTWADAAGAPAVEVAGDALRARWQTPLGDVSLVMRPHGDQDLWVGLEGAQAGGAISMTCGEGEAFFGLGTQATGMDLRGGAFPLWTQEQGIGKLPGARGFPLNNIPEAAYAPMGVLYSSRGYTAVIGHDAFSHYDLCKGDPGRVVLTSYAAQPSFVLVAGDTPAARLEGLTARYTGRLLHDPPPWVLGPWNDAVGGPARVAAVRDLLRAESIPSSAIWTEDWIGGEQSGFGFRLSYAWEWDPSLYPDLPADIDALHAQGFAFLSYFNTFVPQPTRMWAEGVAGGLLVKDAAGQEVSFLDPAFRPAGLVDLTNPVARAWLDGYLMTAAQDLKIDGWMADFSEWLPVDAVMHNGQTGWEAHNRYPLQWQEANTDALTRAHAVGGEPANNWTFFARSGWASIHGGSAGKAPTMWGGDQNTDWAYDDGLPTVVPMAAHAGLAGVAIFGTDIAGYTSVLSPYTDKQLFLRWSTLGAMHGLMRTHHGSDKCGNWTFDRDAETVAHYRRWASIRTLLYPYLRALTAEARATGLPMMRHPYLVAPDLPALWQGRDYSYFLGDALWVAPVLREGEGARAVMAPGAGWWPMLGDAPYDEARAGEAVTVAAPPTELPVWVRPGTILPLLAEVVDSLYGATAPGVTDLSDVEGAYRLALYPDASGALRATQVGDATAAGTGWPRATEDPLWATATATANGAPLPDCPAPPASATACIDRAARTLYAEGADLTLTLGAATLTLTSPTPQRYRVAVAGDAWAPWHLPTPLNDPNPPNIPPCQ